MHIPILASILLAAAPDRPNLAGRVSSGDGPVAGATVMIYTAGVREGSSPFCPSCYADCGKRAVTDDQGRFRIESLDPSLLFQVLIVGEGFEPMFAEKVDPKAGPLAIELERSKTARLDPRHLVRGRVVGPDGQPVVGATVYPHGIATPNGITWGRVEGVDPMAVTDLRGEFALAAEKPDVVLELAIGGPRLASRMFSKVAAGEAARVMKLDEGAYLRGRVVRDGKPVPGVKVGLASANRLAENLMVVESIGTDAEGRFQFNNIRANDNYFVYGIIDSLKSIGSLPSTPGRTGALGTKADVGDLEVRPGLKLSGRIAMVGGGPIPAGTRIRCEFGKAWDIQSALTDEFGRFTFAGLPAGTVTLVVRVPGLRLSGLNQGVDILNTGFIQGQLDRDAESVTILMEVGKGLFEDGGVNPPDINRLLEESRGRRWPGVVLGVDPAIAR